MVILLLLMGSKFSYFVSNLDLGIGGLFLVGNIFQIITEKEFL